jgi:hypothetical protein
MLEPEQYVLDVPGSTLVRIDTSSSANHTYRTAADAVCTLLPD